MPNIYVEGHRTIRACQYNEGNFDSESSFLTAFYIDGVKFAVSITIMRQKAEFSQLSNVFEFNSETLVIVVKPST